MIDGQPDGTTAPVQTGAVDCRTRNRTAAYRAVAMAAVAV
jgi:hypothetical protein